MTQQHDVVTRRDQLAITGPAFREFTGKLANMEFPIENQRAKTKLQFTEFAVIRTIAPYTHPAGELVMNRTSSRGGKPSDRSPWGKLLVSADEQGYPDILDLLNHTLHMSSKEQRIDADPANNREEGSFLIWEIVAVDGVDNRVVEDVPAPAIQPSPDSNPTSPDKATGETEDSLLLLIDGKTVGEFTNAAIGLPMPPQLRARLLDANGLIPGWINSGKVTTDGNIFTRVTADLPF